MKNIPYKSAIFCFSFWNYSITFHCNVSMKNIRYKSALFYVFHSEITALPFIVMSA